MSSIGNLGSDIIQGGGKFRPTDRQWSPRTVESVSESPPSGRVQADLPAVSQQTAPDRRAAQRESILGQLGFNAQRRKYELVWPISPD